MSTFSYQLDIDVLPDGEYDGIAFDISRYGDTTETLTFDRPLGCIQAIKLAEQYLSRPIDYKYWMRVSAGCRHEVYEIRGDCLGSKVYLESTCERVIDGKTILVLRCGS